MAVTQDKTEFIVDRKDAADFLGVSMRTIDRYVKSGKLNHRKMGYHVFLSQRELNDLKGTFSEEVSHVSIVGSEDVPRMYQEAKQQSDSRDVENEIYRELYEHTNLELQKKRKEVEILNYRLGQIETELKNTVPMLEYNGQMEGLEKEKYHLQKEVGDAESKIVKLSQELRNEKTNKMIYFILVLTLVILGSVVFIFQYSLAL